MELTCLSPYAVTDFRDYSEPIPEVGSSPSESDSETIKALREMAQSAGCWLIGGEWECRRRSKTRLSPT